MARGIVQLDIDKYVDWSSVCDAPASYIMTRNELVHGKLYTAGGRVPSVSALETRIS